MLEVAVVIPARYESSRFPGKPLALVSGKSLIRRVWEQCTKAFPENAVFIATDDSRIRKHCEEHRMQCVMTSAACLTGTDRLYEASEKIKADVYVDVQGDEPLIRPQDILRLVNEHIQNPSEVHYGMAPITSEELFRDYSCPKVVTDVNGYLLYTSRAPIPATKSGNFAGAMQQVCISAFSKEHLDAFVSFGRKTPMESIEDLEILRLLEQEYKVKMVQVEPTIAVDFPEDIPVVEAKIRELQNLDI